MYRYRILCTIVTHSKAQSSLRAFSSKWKREESNANNAVAVVVVG